MKTSKETNARRNEADARNTALPEEELAQVAGGTPPELPAAQLVDPRYAGMEHNLPPINPDEKYVMGSSPFTVPDNPEPYEFHLYK